MTGLTMLDSIYNNQFQAGADAYAAYVGGALGDQPNYAFIVRAFPRARHLGIALSASSDADALDVEAGAASPADIIAWHARQAARGIARPVLYASAWTMQTAVIPVVLALPGARSSVRLWGAHYGAGEHICGPGSCGETSIDLDGTQWTQNAMGLVLDQSLLAADFFGTPVPPVPGPAWEEKLMALLPELKKGSTDQQAVKNWQALLVARGYNLGTSGTRKDGVDGSFGATTDSATRAFQAAANIPVDGVVGEKTWTASLTAA